MEPKTLENGKANGGQCQPRSIRSAATINKNKGNSNGKNGLAFGYVAIFDNVGADVVQQCLLGSTYHRRFPQVNTAEVGQIGNDLNKDNAFIGTVFSNCTKKEKTEINSGEGTLSRRSKGEIKGRHERSALCWMTSTAHVYDARFDNQERIYEDKKAEEEETTPASPVPPLQAFLQALSGAMPSFNFYLCTRPLRPPRCGMCRLFKGKERPRRKRERETRNDDTGHRPGLKGTTPERLLLPT